MKTYIIIFNDGASIKINATEVEKINDDDWYESHKVLRFLNGKQVVARVNFDNIIGWFDESSVEEEDGDYISYKYK